jgi:hypothetical protein
VAQKTYDATCPQCGKDVVIPKSTKSFICRHCDAIIKAAETDDGVSLALLGRSVNDDPTYQAFEARVIELQEQIAQHHADYERAASMPVGGAGLKIGVLGVVIAVVGLVGLLTPFWSVARWVAIGGGALAVAGFVTRNAQVRAKLASLAQQSEIIARLAEERDENQRRAARMRVTS